MIIRFGPVGEGGEEGKEDGGPKILLEIACAGIHETYRNHRLRTVIKNRNWNKF